jgi:hypothetical protein
LSREAAEGKKLDEIDEEEDGEGEEEGRPLSVV